MKLGTTLTKQGDLAGLLRELFTETAEVRRFLQENVEKADLVGRLPSALVPLHQYVGAAIEILDNEGLVSQRFFQGLCRLFPKKLNRILEAAIAWKIDLPSDGVFLPERTSVSFIRLPSRLAIWLWGIVKFRSTLEDRKRQIAKFAAPAQIGFLRELPFKVELFHAPEQPRQIAPITIICGGAGMGKSTILTRTIQEKSNPHDLVLILRGAALKDARGTLSIQAILSEISAFQSDACAHTGVAPLSPLGLVYYLRHSAAIIAVEDVHELGDTAYSIQKFIDLLVSNRLHGSGVRLVFTTREQIEISSFPLLGKYLQITRAHPLEPRTAQEFFFKLCTDNGVPASWLVGHGATLGRAFDAPSLCVPLFVVICAWLVAEKKETVSLDALLTMSIVEVYDAYIWSLFKRSRIDEQHYARLRVVYEDLAISDFALVDGFYEIRVAEFLQAHNANNELHLDTAYFVQNGFLSRTHWGSTRLQFPHQSFADHLAAYAILRQEAFGAAILRNESRLKSLPRIIAQICAGETQLLRILRGNVELFIEVVKTHAERKITPSCSAITSELADILQQNLQELESRTLVRLHQLMNTLFPGPGNWLQALQKRLVGDVTALTVKAMCIFERAGTGTRKTIDLWLEKELGELGIEAVRTALTERHVQDAVLKCLRGNPTAARSAFRLLWEVRTRLDLVIFRELAAWTSSNFEKLSDKEFRFIPPKALGRIASMLATAPIPTRQRFSQMVSPILDPERTLIVPGVYSIPGDDEEQPPRNVKINHPILVPRENVTIGGRFKATDAVRASIARRMSLDHLMTGHQAHVAVGYYGQRALGVLGIHFNDPKTHIPEAFWSKKDKLGLYAIPNKQTSQIVSFSAANPSREYIATKVSAREVLRVQEPSEKDFPQGVEER